MDDIEDHKVIDHEIPPKGLCKYDRCNSLYYTNQELREEWDTKVNGDMKDFTKGSDKKKHWICKVDQHHVWWAQISNRTKKDNPRGCPICKNKMVCSVDFCNSVYETHVYLRDQWDWDVNGDMKKFLAGSPKKKSWICPIDRHHIWIAQIKNRTRTDCSINNCPICLNQMICSLDFCNSLYMTHKHLRAEWNWIINGDMRHFSAGSGIKKSWICPTVKHHEWEAIIGDRTGAKDGQGCAICAHKKICIVDYCNSLYICNPELRDEWDFSKNGDMKLYFPFSNQKAGWICPEEKHKYDAVIGSRTRKELPTGCPKCFYKMEQKTRELFEKIFEATFSNCKPKFLKGLQLDGYNKDLKLAFEYQGIQHYEYIPHFHRNGQLDFENQQKRDRLKRKRCKEKGIALIEIPYYESKNLETYIVKELIDNAFKIVDEIITEIKAITSKNRTYDKFDIINQIEEAIKPKAK